MVKSVVLLVFTAPLLVLAQPCVPERYNTNASRVEGKLNVHLVPHTHDDSGWLKTMDQYYYGSNNKIQLAAVQYILDTVVQALAANPDRKFVYGELSFFTRWWREQTSATKDLVRKLVDNGQLDFVNGGYVQHDEAAAHYVAMIDQTTRGHSFLKKQFGKVPTIGWQLDPFGHSATHAALMCGLLGFDGLFFGRADYQDMEVRKGGKQMEVLWRGAQSFGDSADVFTANFPTGNYGAPGGFWYDPWSQDDPIMDDKCLFDYNVQNRVDAFVNASQDLASVTYGNDILIPFGSDFQWVSAHQYYKNVDKLIHYINEDSRIVAFYSTPAEYVAVKHQYNHSWPLKTDDFFPYADCPVCYWTGYFTSRATSKGWIREATAFLQAARQLEALTGAAPPSDTTAAHLQNSTDTADWNAAPSRDSPDTTDRSSAQPSSTANTDSLEEAVSLLQHHDAITGTEKQHVTDDYHIRLARGWKESQKVFTDALADLITAGSSAYAASASEKLLQMPAGSRRLLATPQHRDGSHISAQSTPHMVQLDVNTAARHATAGAARSSNLNLDTPNTTDSANLSREVYAVSRPRVQNADSESLVDPGSDTCQADAVSTVCADKDQPVLATQSWEQEERRPNQGLQLQQCQLLNVSVCEPSVQMSKEGKGFMVAVYNALAWERASESIRVPVNVSDPSAATWEVTDPDGKAVKSQLVPLSHSTKEVQEIMVQEGLLPSLDSAAQHELVFLARLPPVGYAVYTLTPHSEDQTAPPGSTEAAAQTDTYTYADGVLTDTSTGADMLPRGDSLSLDNGLLQLNFSRATGRLTSLTNHQAGVATNLTLDMAAYLSGDKNAGGQNGPPSGAYIFRPDGLVVPTGLLRLHVARGPVLTEMHQVFSDYSTAVIRLWAKALHVEVEWTVGPLPIDDNKGKEVVLRYASSLDSGEIFYTDSNGREYLKRVRNFRPTWNLTVTEPVSGNFYPLTAGAYIQDTSKTELGVLTDRAQGGASLSSGELEVMLHRRTLFDDWRGVGEPLNETMQGCMNCPSEGLIARGRHWLTLQDPKSAALIRRTFQQRLNDPPILSFGPLPGQGRAQPLQGRGLALHFSAVQDALPFNVHLLTLKALPESSVLLRLAHLYQVEEHADLAKPAEVKLLDMFTGWKLSEVSELSLSANQLQSDVQRLKWQAGKSLSGDATDQALHLDQHPAIMCAGQQCLGDGTKVVLSPMEIKTFLLKVA